MKNLFLVSDPRGVIGADGLRYPLGTTLDAIPADDARVSEWRRAHQVALMPHIPSGEQMEISRELVSRSRYVVTL